MLSKLSVIVLGLGLFLTSCSTPQDKDLLSTNDDQLTLESMDLGSALPKDKDKRIAFLKEAVEKKSAKLQDIKDRLKAGDIREEDTLTSELLMNEILLLEAERYGLEEGYDL